VDDHCGHRRWTAVTYFADYLLVEVRLLQQTPARPHFVGQPGETAPRLKKPTSTNCVTRSKVPLLTDSENCHTSVYKSVQ